MGLLRDDAGDRSYVQRFANAERLCLLASDVVDDWAVRNAPDGVGRLYAAYTSDDRWLVVTVPHSSHDELDRVRVFFGPSEHVRERELFVFARPRGPTSVEVFFDLEGERVKASFPVDCGPERYRPDCPGTLVRATEQPSLTQLSHGTPVPEHLRFVCVRPRSES